MHYKIGASILNADFLRLGEQIAEVVPHVDEIHLDVMDGVFVENISFGVPVAAGIRSAHPGAVIDTHLMISRPHRYWKEFVAMGSNIVTFHREATDHAYALLAQLRDAGVSAGLVVNPATDVRSIEPVRDYLDRLLIMTVEPGFGGQGFIPAMLRKIETARAMLGDEVDIQVDGGINDRTIADARSAGANVFVVGSFIFAAADKAAQVHRLRERLA